MAVLEFLQLLARAERQFRTYPATSRLCTDAIDACQAAFVALRLEQPLLIRVTARQLLVGDEAVAPDPAIEHDLRQPLRAARVASIELDCHASARDWTQLCVILAAAGRPSREMPGVAERLLDAGVGAIVARTTPHPEVFDIGVPAAPVRRIVDAERSRQTAASAGAAQYLYPPDKGWIRLDPAVTDDSISLVDLTVLVSDPARLAAMLARLVDDAAADAPEGDPLHERYDDVVMLIGALEPRLGRVLLAKLARTVLDLDSDRRRALLRRSVLPRLLDGRADSEAVLAEFPDVDLAEALSLLLDLEAASPQLLPFALDHLRLPIERRNRMIPLIQSTLDGRAAPGLDRWASAGLDQHARTLINIDASVPRDFAEFAAFDLSIDEHTAAALDDARRAVAGGDPTDAWLACTLGLARIEPNPATVESIVARAIPALQAFVRNQRWRDATRWLARVAELTAALEPARPDVAQAIRQALVRFCDRDVLLRLALLSGTDEGRTYAGMIVAAVGSSIVAPWLDALSSPADRSRVLPLRSVMCECARHVGPGVAERLPALPPEAALVAVAVLGFAGPGYEDAVAARASGGDERICREALRALARIASPKAAALVAWQLEHGDAAIQPAAEEALWRLPVKLALARTRDFLSRRDFVTRHPEIAARLLERAAHGGAADLSAVLELLAPLRFRVWSPALARVGARAHNLL